LPRRFPQRPDEQVRHADQDQRRNDQKRQNRKRVQQRNNAEVEIFLRFVVIGTLGVIEAGIKVELRVGSQGPT
jgi:hypothetical protein